MLGASQVLRAQEQTAPASTVVADSLLANDSLLMADSLAAGAMVMDDPEADEDGGFHKQLKTKFIDGNAGFMSLVALALVLGLAFCIERITYLTLSEINAKKLMKDIDAKVAEGDVEGA